MAAVFHQWSSTAADPLCPFLQIAYVDFDGAHNAVGITLSARKTRPGESVTGKALPWIEEVDRVPTVFGGAGRFFCKYRIIRSGDGATGISVRLLLENQDRVLVNRVGLGRSRWYRPTGKPATEPPVVMPVQTPAVFLYSTRSQPSTSAQGLHPKPLPAVGATQLRSFAPVEGIWEVVASASLVVPKTSHGNGKICHGRAHCRPCPILQVYVLAIGQRRTLGMQVRLCIRQQDPDIGPVVLAR